MKINGNQYELTPAGVVAHSCDDGTRHQKGTIILSFTDVLSLDDQGQVLSSQDCRALGSLVQRWIAEHLVQACKSDTDKERLSAAFAYANQRLLQSDATGLNQVAVSAIVGILTDDGKNVLLAGVGDARVYKVSENGTILAFADPLNNDLRPGSGPENRLFTLNNAIGIREDLVVHTEHTPLEPATSLLAASYGFLDQSSEEELSITLKGNIKETDTLSLLLETKTQRGHAVHVDLFDFEQPKPDITPLTVNQHGNTPIPTENSRHKKQKIAALGLSAATCALLLGVSITMFNANSAPSSSSTTTQDSKQKITVEKAVVKGPPLLSTEQELLVSSLREKVTQSNSQIEFLQDQLSQMQEKINLQTIVKDNGNDEKKRLKLLLERMRAKDLALVKSTEKQKLLEQEISNTGKRIAYLEKTIDTLENVIDTKEEAGSDTTSELQDQVTYLEERSAKERGDLLTTLEARDAEITKLKDLNSTTLNTLSCAEKELSEAITTAESLNQERQNNKILSASLKEAQNELQEKRETLTALKIQLAEAEEVKERNANLAEQVSRLQDKLSQLAGWEERYQQEVSARHEIEQVLRDKQAVVNELKNSLKEQQHLIVRLGESRNALKEELENVSQEYNAPLIATTSTPSSSIQDAPRVHLVSRGDTLTAISSKYYGTSKRWRDIFEANQDTIANVNEIRIGTALVIP